MPRWFSGGRLGCEQDKMYVHTGSDFESATRKFEHGIVAVWMNPRASRSTKNDMRLARRVSTA